MRSEALLVEGSGDVDKVRLFAAALRLQQTGQLPIGGQECRVERNRPADQGFRLIAIPPEHPRKLSQHGAMGDQRIDIAWLEGESFLDRMVSAPYQKQGLQMVFAGFQLPPQRAEDRKLGLRTVGKAGRGPIGKFDCGGQLLGPFLGRCRVDCFADSDGAGGRWRGADADKSAL